VLEEGVGVGGAAAPVVVAAAPAAGNGGKANPAGNGGKAKVRVTIADVKTPGPADSVTAPDFKWQFLLLVL